MKNLNKEKIKEVGIDFISTALYGVAAISILKFLPLIPILPVSITENIIKLAIEPFFQDKIKKHIENTFSILKTNKNLESIIKKSLNSSFLELEEDLLRIYKSSNDKIKSTISSLININKSFDYINSTSKAHNNSFVENFINNNYKNILELSFQEWDNKYSIQNNLPPDFREVYLIRFTLIFKKNLHQELSNESNKTTNNEYILLLLESILSLNKTKNSKLDDLHNELKLAVSKNEPLEIYSKEILKLSTLTVELLPSLKRQLEDLKNTLSEQIQSQNQPNLLIPIANRYKSEEYDFRYKAEYTTFVGRENELESLRKFSLKSIKDKNFLWWYLVGKGGSGKSRIAHELCLQLKVFDFYAGFIEKDSIKNNSLWNKWKPIKHTLIIVDYANEQIEATISLIKSLESRQYTFDYNVRLLLIDRELTKEIKEKIGIDIEVEKSSYTNLETPLFLEPMEDEILWKIIEEIHTKNKKSIIYSKEEILSSLYQIDNFKRPLFAFLSSVALLEGNDIRGWNKTMLLEKLIIREEDKIWKSTTHDRAFIEKHKTLIAIATLARGISNDFIDHLNTQDYSWFNKNITIENSFYELMSSIIYFENNVYYLGLEPDILGEYYVLRQLYNIYSSTSNGKKNVLNLLNELWDYYPVSFVFMTLMLLQDFETSNSLHSKISDILINMKPKKNAKLNCFIMWARFIHTLANPSLYSQVKNKEDLFSQLYKESFRLNSEEMFVVASFTALNFTAYFGKEKNSEKLFSYLESIKFCKHKYPNNELIASCYADALRNNILDGINKKSDEQVTKFFDELRNIKNLSPWSEKISYTYTQSFVDMVTLNMNHATPYDFLLVNYKSIVTILEEIREISISFTYNKFFIISYNKIICLLSSAFSKGLNNSASIKYKKTAEKIKNDNTNNIEIISDYFLLISNLTLHSLYFTYEEDTLLGYYDELEVLWDSNKEHRNISLMFAKTNFKIILSITRNQYLAPEQTTNRIKNNSKKIEVLFNDMEFTQYTYIHEDSF